MNVFSLQNKNSDYSLKIGITFHKYVFVIKTLLIFLNIKVANDEIEGMERSYLKAKVLILCIININYLIGFLWALLNKSLICYQTTFVVSLGLFAFETLYIIQVILLAKKVTNFFVFACNILNFLLSLFEIIFIKIFVYYVGVSSIRRFTSFTADYNILELIRIRTRVVVLRIFIPLYIIISLFIFCFTHMTDKDNDVYIFFKHSLLNDMFVLSLNLVVLSVFVILSIGLDRENLQQRIILLILISIVVISDLSVGVFQIVKYWNIGDYSLFYHFFRGLFFIYAFFVIFRDYRNCGKGLKEFFEKLNKRSLNKI